LLTFTSPAQRRKGDRPPKPALAGCRAGGGGDEGPLRTSGGATRPFSPCGRRTASLLAAADLLRSCGSWSRLTDA